LPFTDAAKRPAQIDAPGQKSVRKKPKEKQLEQNALNESRLRILDASGRKAKLTPPGTTNMGDFTERSP
jgi:hypothetical protein